MLPGLAGDPGRQAVHAAAAGNRSKACQHGTRAAVGRLLHCKGAHTPCAARQAAPAVAGGHGTPPCAPAAAAAAAAPTAMQDHLLVEVAHAEHYQQYDHADIEQLQYQQLQHHDQLLLQQQLEHLHQQHQHQQHQQLRMVPVQPQQEQQQQRDYHLEQWDSHVQQQQQHQQPTAGQAGLGDAPQPLQEQQQQHLQWAWHTPHASGVSVSGPAASTSASDRHAADSSSAWLPEPGSWGHGHHNHHSSNSVPGGISNGGSSSKGSSNGGVVAAEPLLPAVEPTLQGFRLEPRQRPGGGPAGASMRVPSKLKHPPKLQLPAAQQQQHQQLEPSPSAGLPVVRLHKGSKPAQVAAVLTSHLLQEQQVVLSAAGADLALVLLQCLERAVCLQQQQRPGSMLLAVPRFRNQRRPEGFGRCKVFEVVCSLQPCAVAEQPGLQQQDGPPAKQPQHGKVAKPQQPEQQEPLPLQHTSQQLQVMVGDAAPVHHSHSPVQQQQQQHAGERARLQQQRHQQHQHQTCLQQQPGLVYTMPVLGLHPGHAPVRGSNVLPMALSLQAAACSNGNGKRLQRSCARQQEQEHASHGQLLVGMGRQDQQQQHVRQPGLQVHARAASTLQRPQQRSMSSQQQWGQVMRQPQAHTHPQAGHAVSAMPGLDSSCSDTAAATAAVASHAGPTAVARGMGHAAVAAGSAAAASAALAAPETAVADDAAAAAAPAAAGGGGASVLPVKVTGCSLDVADAVEDGLDACSVVQLPVAHPKQAVRALEAITFINQRWQHRQQQQQRQQRLAPRSSSLVSAAAERQQQGSSGSGGGCLASPGLQLILQPRRGKVQGQSGSVRGLHVFVFVAAPTVQ